MHEWILQNWMILFGIISSIWFIKWMFCFFFKGPNGRWKWEK